MKLTFVAAFLLLLSAGCSITPERKISSTNLDFITGQESPETCADLSDPKKEVSVTPFDIHALRAKYPIEPGFTEDRYDIGRFQQLSWDLSAPNIFRNLEPSLHFICGVMNQNDKDECYSEFLGSYVKIVECHGNKLPREGNRHIISSFLRNPKLQKMTLMVLLAGERAKYCFKGPEGFSDLKVQLHCLEVVIKEQDQPFFRKRLQIWEEFGVIVLAPGLIYNGKKVENISLEGLNRIYVGYANIKKAFDSLNSDRDLSHAWGHGGFLVRTHDMSINGQFGEVDSNNPLAMIMVTDPSVKTHLKGFVSAAKSSSEVAERIGHESFHANDFLTGRLSFNTLSWSEEGRSRERLIQQLCNASSARSLRSCRNSKPLLFSFRPGSSYPASNVYEFYASMVNIWVRNKLNGQKGTYHCKSTNTKRLWEEMELQMLGFVHSSCD